MRAAAARRTGSRVTFRRRVAIAARPMAVANFGARSCADERRAPVSDRQAEPGRGRPVSTLPADLGHPPGISIAAAEFGKGPRQGDSATVVLQSLCRSNRLEELFGRMWAATVAGRVREECCAFAP